MLRLTPAFITLLLPNIVQAYIDTTVKDFAKPEIIKVQAYKYEVSKIDNFIDLAADKVGGSFYWKYCWWANRINFKGKR